MCIRDRNNTGFASRIAWVTGNEGVLAIDLNNNDYLDNGSELIGWQPETNQSLDSFDALRAYDSNNDGIISAADTSFSQLIVQKADGLVVHLSDLGISSINLSKQGTNVTDSSGNTQTSVSSFTRSDGTTGAIASYILQQDTWDTLQLNPVPISSTIEALPDAVGSGFVSNLSQAMQALSLIHI